MTEEEILTLARARARASGQGPKQYSGSILPFSVDSAGKSHFDSNAGVVGMAKRFLTIGRDAYDGNLDLDRGPKHPLEPDPTIERVTEAAGVMSPMGTGARAAVRPGRPVTPTADDLFEQAGRQYDAVRSSGVDYNSGSVGNLATGLRTALERDGILDVNAPQTHAIIGRLTNPPANSVVEIQHLEAARRAFGKIAQSSQDSTERGAAQRAVEAISGFIERADPADVVAGPAAEAGRTIGQARGNYAAGMRSDSLTGIERAADLRAAAANSGQNTGNSIRSRLASLLLNKEGRNVRGYSGEEVGAIEGVVNGSRAANTTRRLGNILGGGGGMATAVVGGIGGAAGAAAGGAGGAALGAAIPPIVGAGLKAGSNALTRRALRNVDDMVRQRSPLMDERRANPPMTPVHSGRAAALARALALIEAEERARQQ